MKYEQDGFRDPTSAAIQYYLQDKLNLLKSLLTLIKVTSKEII